VSSLGVKLTPKILFPKDFPPATVGIFLKDRNLLITGHHNGFLVEWNLKEGGHEILSKSDSRVTTISFSGDSRIAVGYHSGGLYVIDLDNRDQVATLRIPKHTTNSRIWRTAWVDKNNLLLTSTYGEVTPFFESNKTWKENEALNGHEHSVFGIGSTNGEYVATGDYQGNIIVWKVKDNEYRQIQRLGVVGTVDGLYWHDENCFAVITDTGRIYQIERESKELQTWQTAVVVDIANFRGICISITEDGETIFAGTSDELIQFDLDSNLSETTTIPDIKGIFPSGNETYILTANGFYVFRNKPVEISRELINYRFTKISLLGHTGTGKTTFCKRLIRSEIDDIKSTFGKRIFNLKLEGENERRIIFHDHGGQETVLDTFIPFILDSDLILIFYSQIDKITFDKSLEILKEIKAKVNLNIPVYFIQTFIDHQLDEIPQGVTENLIEEGKISGLMRISPKDNIGFDEFDKQVLTKINWDKSRIMIQSPFIAGISETLSVLHKNNYPFIKFDEFKQRYQEVIDDTISEPHLRFLLKDYINQGIIEYYPAISELIVLDDKTFNKMRTDIPIYADHKDGIVDIKDLQKRFEHAIFLAMLDEMYLQSGVAIKNGDLRIFPHKLSSKSLDIPSDNKPDFAHQDLEEVFLNYQDIKIHRLIEMLSEQYLQCIGLTKYEGLFAWEKNAFVYYFIQEERKGVFEKFLKISFAIGGKKEKSRERLRKIFKSIIERIFGSQVTFANNENIKKKKLM